MARRFLLILSALALVAPMLGACVSTGGDSRTIEVDGASDDFAGTFRAFFPRDIRVQPGMTLKFHQTWTGEPHSVTLGTEVQDRIEPELLPIVLRSKSVAVPPTEDFPDDVDAAAEEFFGTLPFFFGERGVNQAAGQPCYLDTGLPTGEKACAQRSQPAFNGRQSYYSSGFIPYLGEQGNEFEMKIADDAKPGTYFYYCNLHGPDMNGQITITGTEGKVPSQADVNRQAKKERDAIAKPLIAQLEKERAGNGEFKGNLAGSGTDANQFVKGQVNEFTPRTVQAKVNQPVTWTFILAHSVSFNVPAYVPFYDVKKNGNVVQSETIFGPAGGWPGRNPPTESEGGPDQGQALPAANADAGKFDGSKGLKSSGVDWQTGDTYTVTFTKAGTYPMACLVHPGMVGKVVVT